MTGGVSEGKKSATKGIPDETILMSKKKGETASEKKFNPSPSSRGEKGRVFEKEKRNN